jgi:hypothetical protein
VPEARQRREASKFHNALLTLGRKLGKRVMITFSNKGDNRTPGLGAIKAHGFAPYGETAYSEMFIKGI